MDVILVIVGRDALKNASALTRIETLLNDRNFALNEVVYAETKERAAEEITRRKGDEVLFVATGDIDELAVTLGTGVPEGMNRLSFNGMNVVLMRGYDENTIRETVIPLLNARSRVTYNTVIFKTFGQTADALRERLKQIIKNRNKIVLDFVESGMTCDVRVRYSRATSSTAITDIIGKINEELSDCIYALKDVTLAHAVATRLLASGKKLCIAESFTGGGLASALIATPGMSNALIESIVCYSNDSKAERLGVPRKVIADNGAVSADTAFEMANGLLADPACDVAIATTGNAGPTAEAGSQVGLFYIAIGDRHTIHVFEQYKEVKDAENRPAEEIRREITQAGIDTALFELGKYLKENDRRDQ